ncbi:Resolvase, N-terminal domain protein [Operophtera brumata]|uniref:Resolvase, N-terminal domain protein n=1 Tax=Operophtera brumata TaxID=104452 RepID=A0A0L7LPQ0_OPEBR|nr:Resolvase, N-terminal domain protein [Operophtera brumata]
MKRHKTFPALIGAHNFKIIVEENRRLHEQLLEAIDKQHQEMSRALQLKELNSILKRELHEAKIEACQLRENIRLDSNWGEKA